MLIGSVRCLHSQSDGAKALHFAVYRSANRIKCRVLEEVPRWVKLVDMAHQPADNRVQCLGRVELTIFSSNFKHKFAQPFVQLKCLAEKKRRGTVEWGANTAAVSGPIFPDIKGPGCTLCSVLGNCAHFHSLDVFVAMRCSKPASERVGLGFSAGSGDRGVGLRIEGGGVCRFEFQAKSAYTGFSFTAQALELGCT